MFNLCGLRIPSFTPMASCRNNKYSLDELRRFNDRIENILNHEACRKEFRQFLRDIRRNDLVNILEIWELANDIKKNTPGSPERRRKFEELEDKLDEEPDFSAILDDVDKVRLTYINTVSTRKRNEATKRLFGRQGTDEEVSGLFTKNK
ncbi:hypothetical protein CBL_06410 [Carabus blaptoides fortunei]